MIINPRRACAARVTAVCVRESWGAFFSMKGEKEGGKGRGSKCKLRREIQTSYLYRSEESSIIG